MVKKWFTEFRCGRTSTSDAERSGRPKEVVTPEIVDKIHGMILDDRRMKVREVAEAVGISTERVHHILHEYLDMKKLSARWVPRLLTLDHKRNRVTISKECLAMFSRNPNEFLRRFVTVDETWIHHTTPETKEQSRQWVSSGERAPKKAKVGLSANKVMATVFWDARGIIHIDYLEKGKTITSEYYSELLDRFDIDFKQKRPHLAKKKVLFHQDNARVHTCVVTMAKIHKLGYKLLLHAAYSPDLAPCDYFLFPNLKKWLGGKRFGSNEEVITETNAYFESLEKTYYLEGIKKLEKRWTKCIELNILLCNLPT
ncbi:histone-lysine N-methyltransferase SETMAR-like [Harpegnathos saltator]|uniref:histone-lysine N-methyltransferase SETMAR-like n=1 Tax=Harpegnathos saltator TaxID=610380 RepID=UPI000DBECF7D|nr:histone-lysine N-methyltransferase SETMAR-like [Harpegnathos saltator]